MTHTGHESIAKLLVENGADVNVINAEELKKAIEKSIHFVKSVQKKNYL